MRCPRCGGALEATADGLACWTGEMELSRYVERELARWLDVGSADEPGAPCDWGGAWHCPADGTRMIEADGRFTCPRCRRRMPRRLAYILIELHTHRPVGPPDDVPA